MTFCTHIRAHALHGAAAALASAMIVGCCAIPSTSAYAVTAAEKQAEADAVWAQVDSLQTNLNKAMDEYERAKEAHDDALKRRDEASAKIEQETKRIEQLQSELSQFARGMYRQGGAGSFLDVLMDTTTFEQFLTTWDACSAISDKGMALIDDAKQARADLEKARADYEQQGERAEAEMESAEASRAEIEETQAALREQAESLSAEAAELQYQEELAAEAARQAEEARKQREAELAAAAQAAADAEKAKSQEGSEGDGGDDQTEDAGAGAGDAVVVGSGYFTNPCPGAVSSSGFGYRDFDNSFHKGLDMAAAEGTPYYAADSGTVMYATNDGGYNGGAGNWVVISHGNGIVTKYMHSSATYVRPGDYVERGQNIGAVGNTGNSFGAHLHFQVEIGGVAVNPLNYI